MRVSGEEVIGYINAGGRGTRLARLFDQNEKTGIAKALLSIGNPKIRLVDHHINSLRLQGFEKVVIAAGEQDQVFEYVNDVYADDDSVFATKSHRQLGTGGDLLVYARQDETVKDIVVQNVDTILDLDVNSFVQEFEEKKMLGGVAAIALTFNRGVPNQDAYFVSESGQILHSNEFSESGKIDDRSLKYRASSTGAVAINAAFVRNNSWQPHDNQLSLYRHILNDAREVDGLYGYDNGTKFFRDVGTVATWLSSQDDIELQSHLKYNKA